MIDPIRSPYFNPPATTEDVDILIPIRGRPEKVQGVSRAFSATSHGGCKLRFVPDSDDWESISAVRDAGHVPMVWEVDEWGRGTYAKKINYAAGVSTDYRVGSEWVLLAADDVTPGERWLDYAMGMLRWFPSAKVIGTNDLTNPRVICGVHSTHSLVSMGYAKQGLATWDGVKEICHEGYGHNFVDDELVTVAKQRGVFVHSPLSVISHQHPIGGTIPMDDTYRLGQSTYREDEALFLSRLRAHS